MKYNFNRVIERQSTYAIKYNTTGRGKPKDVLPLWVADMDFQSPPCVLDALRDLTEHGVFGYSDTNRDYFETLYAWFHNRFGWKTEQDWLVNTPGVVTAIYIAIRALTSPGDAVIIQQPVYYPFAEAVTKTGRKLVVNRLENDGGYYLVDLHDFERKIIENRVKLFILCSPHNPMGRVWTREELMQMGEICLRNGVVVVADEIHQDFVYPGNKHIVFAGLDDSFRDIALTCTAPSKTFNLAGLQNSNIFIASESLRSRFEEEYTRSGLSQVNLMGIASCQAAYAAGGDWLEELLTYLDGNMALIQQSISKCQPVKFTKPEGTYLAWLDFQELGMNAVELDNFITNKARLWLNSGYVFGAGGDGFMRLNAACPRPVIAEGLSRLKSALDSL